MRFSHIEGELSSVSHVYQYARPSRKRLRFRATSPEKAAHQPPPPIALRARVPRTNSSTIVVSTNAAKV